MGKVKDAMIEAQEFAQCHFNTDKESFMVLAKHNFGLGTIQYREAIDHFNTIQNDLADWESMMEDYYNDPESPLYADSPYSEDPQSWKFYKEEEEVF